MALKPVSKTIDTVAAVGVAVVVKIGVAVALFVRDDGAALGAELCVGRPARACGGGAWLSRMASCTPGMITAKVQVPSSSTRAPKPNPEPEAPSQPRRHRRPQGPQRALNMPVRARARPTNRFFARAAT